MIELRDPTMRSFLQQRAALDIHRLNQPMRLEERADRRPTLRYRLGRVMIGFGSRMTGIAIDVSKFEPVRSA